MPARAKVANLGDSPARRLMTLFPASTRGHAYWTPGQNESETPEGKVKVGYVDVKIPVSELHWQHHIEGKRALVIDPVCDDGTAKFACLDVDLYNGGRELLAVILSRMDALANGWPLYLLQSKSGGAHIDCFTEYPLSAHEQNLVARGLAQKLGLIQLFKDKFPDTKKSFFEFFPYPPKGKRSRQLNMPYLGKDNQATGYLTRELQEIPLEDFLSTVRYLSDVQIAELKRLGNSVRQNAEKKRPPESGGGTDEEVGAAFAEKTLAEYAAELEALGPGERNVPLMNRMRKIGRMINSGWITHDRVHEVMANALRDWDEKAMQDVARHIASVDDKHSPLTVSGSKISEPEAAAEFALRHGEDVRFDWEEEVYYLWDGVSWVRSIGDPLFNMILDMMKELIPTYTEPKMHKFVSKTFITAVEHHVRRLPGIYADQSIWDTDKMLLGTPSGTVDLRTGELREPKREEYITRLTSVGPAPMPTPIWDKFMLEATGGDESLVKFMHTLVGYSATGDTSEELLIFVYGDGGTGKGTFTKAVGTILHQYHKTAAMETFSASKFDKHPADLADLRGARMVTASETQRGREWDEQRIKMLTGRDMIKARFMHKDFFEYEPQFQPVIYGNHRPRLMEISEATMRRLVMVPFVHKPKVKNKKLKDQLVAEYPGILQRIIDGAVEWSKNGMPLPDIVIASTKEYFDGEDVMGQWVRECVERVEPTLSRKVSLTDIFQAWASHTRALGMEEKETGDSKMMGAKLRSVFGLTKDEVIRSNAKTWYRVLRLVRDNPI